MSQACNIKTTWINHVGLILHDFDIFNIRGPHSQFRWYHWRCNINPKKYWYYMAARIDTIIISKLAAADPQGKLPRHIHCTARQRRQQQWRWWPHMLTTRPWARAPGIFISRRAAATVGRQGLMCEHTTYSHCILQWRRWLWQRRRQSLWEYP